ncbi:MAG: M14 family zinc carboxypeptidase [Gammaproteobacteria bacterium]|nr:M14 family zinc carboxypeptidase [Gammaproteobacteria bacterium]
MLQFKHTLLLLSFSLSGSVALADQVIVSSCQDISNKLGSVHLESCLSHKLDDSGYRSRLNKPLLIKEYPPLGQRIPQAKILLLGGIHGDEYSSVSIVFKWLSTLDKYHSGLFHWKIIPLLNPDGLLRKPSHRTNGNGVDLNRNFSPGSNKQASLDYWVKRTRKDSRRYPGPAPVSEPETQWLEKLINDFNPDVIIAVHAPFGILDFDGPHQAPKHLGSLHLKLLGTYPGSLGNYAGIQLGKPVITIELPHAGIMPSKQHVSGIWTDLVRWLKQHAKTTSTKQKLLHAETEVLQKSVLID